MIDFPNYIRKRCLIDDVYENVCWDLDWQII